METYQFYWKSHARLKNFFQKGKEIKGIHGLIQHSYMKYEQHDKQNTSKIERQLKTSSNINPFPLENARYYFASGKTPVFSN